jgi:hypothetical protein
MPDNPFDEKFMDDAWSLMNNQLNEVMPQERKRRFFFWWWFLPSLGLSVVLLGLFLPKLDWNTPQPQNNSIPTTESHSPEPIAEAQNTTTQALQNQKLQTTKTLPESTQERPAPNPKEINPNIPNGQDPVTNPSVQVPEARVLHTESEIPQSEQQVPEMEQVTDLRFFSPFDLLNKQALEPIFSSSTDFKFNYERTKPKGLLAKRGTASIFAATAYEPLHERIELAAGIGWKQQKGRFFLRLEPGLHRGSSLIRPTQFTTSENSIDSPGTSTNLDPGGKPTFGANNQEFSIDFQYLTLEAPLTLGYYFNEKWSLEGGLQWTKVLQFKESNTLAESTLDALKADQEFTANQTSFDFDNLLQRRSWLEGRLGLNYQLSTRFEMQAAYRVGHANTIKGDQINWSRDQWSIRMRYRIQ